MLRLAVPSIFTQKVFFASNLGTAHSHVALLFANGKRKKWACGILDAFATHSNLVDKVNGIQIAGHKMAGLSVMFLQSNINFQKTRSKYNKPALTTLDKASQIPTCHLHFIRTSHNVQTSQTSLKAQRTSAAYLDEVRQTVIGHLGFLGALPTFLRDVQRDSVQQLLKPELAVG